MFILLVLNSGLFINTSSRAPSPDLETTALDITFSKPNQTHRGLVAHWIVPIKLLLRDCVCCDGLSFSKDATRSIVVNAALALTTVVW